jgi:hypothetical protein
MATLDQPELIEPEIEETGTEAGSGAPASGAGPASDVDDAADQSSQTSN